MESFTPPLSPLPNAAGAVAISIAHLGERRVSPQCSKPAATRRECQTGSKVDLSFTDCEQPYLLPAAISASLLASADAFYRRLGAAD